MIQITETLAIGEHQPAFIIAEIGVNHNGDLDLACQLIDIATDAGASAVKFQTFKTEKLVTRQAAKADYQTRTTGGEESQYEMLKRLELSPADYEAVLEYCQHRNILFLSTPFDEDSADFLEQLGVCAYKIPSGEITNLPYLAHIAAKGKPMIVSTGMSTLGEVETAVDTIRENGNPAIVLLHCVSQYPAPYEASNLYAMSTLAQAFSVPTGFSDHTMGIEIALAAVALGARVIEKHLTLDRDLPGPDHRASAAPEEFKAMVAGIRKVEAALGDGIKRPAACESDVRTVARKSLVAAVNIPAGMVSDACLSTVDFTPTFLGLLGLPVPSRMEGMNLSHLALNQSGPEPDAAFMQGTGATANWETGHEWRAVRNKQYTYAKFRIDRVDADQELLFDHTNDPYQLTNLVSDPQHQTTLQELRNKLTEKMQSLSDTFEASTYYRDNWTDGNRIILRGARG